MRKIDDEMKAYYRARAAEYETIYYRDDLARRKELADAVDALVILAQDKSVLEFACGTGYWTAAMGKSARSITALDFSAEMVEQAKRKEYRCPVTFAGSPLTGASPASFPSSVLSCSASS